MTFLPRTFANDVQMQHFSFSLLIVSIGVLFLPVPCVATHIDETVFRLPAEHIQAPGGICVAGCKIAGTAVCDLIRFPFDLSALPCQLRFHLMQPQQVTVPTAGKLKTKYRCFVFIFSSCFMRWNSYSLFPQSLRLHLRYDHGLCRSNRFLPLLGSRRAGHIQKRPLRLQRQVVPDVRYCKRQRGLDSGAELIQPVAFFKSDAILRRTDVTVRAPAAIYTHVIQLDPRIASLRRDGELVPAHVVRAKVEFQISADAFSNRGVCVCAQGGGAAFLTASLRPVFRAFAAAGEAFHQQQFFPRAPGRLPRR